MYRQYYRITLEDFLATEAPWFSISDLHSKKFTKISFVCPHKMSDHACQVTLGPARDSL